MPVSQSLLPHTAWMVVIEDTSCEPNCDESYKDEWSKAAAELKSGLSNEPAILMGTLNKDSIDSE